MAEKKTGEAPTIKVRFAEPKDIVNIGKVLKDGDSRLTVPYAPVDDVRLHQWILEVIDQGICAVADLSGRIVGVIGASAYQPKWSREWAMDVEIYYIMPTFRGAGLEKALLSAVEGWCDAKARILGVRIPLLVTINSGEKPEVKDRMLGIRGYRYCGGNFTRMYDGQQDKENDVDNDAS
jgi:GNAT superfamily N-acetyltransferase